MARKDGNQISEWVVFAFLFVGAATVGSGIGQITGDQGAWGAIGAGVGFILGAVYFIVRDRTK